MSIAKDVQVLLAQKTAVTLRGDHGMTLRAEVTPRNEYSLKMECATGWETILLVGNGGDVLMQRTLFEAVAATVAAMLQSAAAKASRAIATVQPESAPRCAFYREIRRCYAIAREAGCDVKADEAMRASFSRFLGRAVSSREELNGSEWYEIGSAIKTFQLSW